MHQQITTVSTFVPATTAEDRQYQGRKIAERTEDLQAHAQSGWSLAHTATIPGPEGVTFVDTLTRTPQQ